MHRQKPFAPKLAERYLGLFFSIELGLSGNGLAQCVSGFFPRHVTSQPKDQRFVFPMLFAVGLKFVHVEVAPPSLPGFARYFKPTILAALAARPRRITRRS